MCEDEETPYAPGVYDFKSVVRGDTWRGVTFTIVVNGEPLDLDGALVEIAFRFSGKQGDVKLLLTTDNGSLTVSGNVITIAPRPMTMSPGKYSWDLQITDANDAVRTYLEGTLTVLRDSTP